MGAHVSVPMYRRTLAARVGLEGRRCDRCSAVSFPPRGACGQCRGRSLTPVRLSGVGTLQAWTYITAAGAPPEFAAQVRRDGGYHVGLVALQEGPRVAGQLVDVSDPEIGQPVRAVVRRLYEEEGVVRYGFKFAPHMGEQLPAEGV